MTAVGLGVVVSDVSSTFRNAHKVIVKNSNVNDRFGGSGASHCVAQSNLVCYDSYDSCKLIVVVGDILK
jgi:hypothetical protein